MKKRLLFIIPLISTISYGQNWERLPSSSYAKDIPSTMQGYGDQVQGYYADYDQMVALFRKSGSSFEQGKIINIPDVSGTVVAYKVWETPVMHPDLASRYPEIKTYTAVSVDDRTVTAKINIDPTGFHFMNYGNQHTTIITSSPSERNTFLVTSKNDYQSSTKPICEHDEMIHSVVPNETIITDGETLAQRTFGINRKTYQLALACTYEYSVAVTGSSTPTRSAVLAAMTLTLNRVNGVYEREFSATMTLVPNNDTLIFITSSDPYTNDDGFGMLGENITTCNARIGSSNFDIGHVFSTGGGGVAYLSSLCNNSVKAGGVTGLPNPVGDPFAIDYVAHEVGHQYGGPHTFNANTGACNGNGSSSNAVEPGSGTTIMAYAGICGTTNNIQNFSDPYFSVASLRNITNHLNGAGGTCATITTTTNVPNTLPAFTADAYTIPVNTPFELTAPTAIDATADTLLYSWEEYDLGGFGLSWDADNNLMPYFRSFLPSTSPTRSFPRVNSVLAGTLYNKGERIPRAARTLRFVLTARDIYEGWGAFSGTFDVDTVVITVAAATDTFKVTSQAITETWQEGYAKTVTWTVANTNASPVNASSVDIYLSADSAQTFPYHLGTFPNNGSATVIVPSGITSANGRIKVKGTNNIFYQLNRSNINIIPTPLAMQDLSLTITDAGACANRIDWEYQGDVSLVSEITLSHSIDGNNFSEIYKTADPSLIAKGNVENRVTQGAASYYKMTILHQDMTTATSKVYTVYNQCEDDTWSMYPNPVRYSESVNVLSKESIGTIIVYDAIGRVVLSADAQQQSSYTLPTHILSPGVYLIKINGEASSSMKKLVVR